MDVKQSVREHFGAAADNYAASWPHASGPDLQAMLEGADLERGDRVLDPFLGTGTTIFAAMANGRHSVGYELDGAFFPELEAAVSGLPGFAHGHLDARVQRHRDFVAAREQSHGPLKYRNRHHDFAVMTRQETEISLHHVAAMEHRGEGVFAVEYEQQSLG